MTQYAVCHIQRGNSNGSGLSTHIERKTKSGKPFIPSNADPTRTHLNRELLAFPDGVKDRNEAIKYRLDNAGLKRKVAKNQTTHLCTILSGSHDQMMKIVKEGKLSAWANANIRWLEDTFGKENLVSCVLHMDEKTPHLHATIIPIVITERKRREREGKKKYRTTNGPRLSADDLMHRSMLKKYQDSYGEAMKEFGLERGILGSAAKHVSNSEYYKLKMESIHENIEMLNQKVLVKQEEVEELERQKASAEEGKSYIYSLFNKGKLSEARKLIEKQNGEIESLKEQIARLEKEKTLLYKQSEKKHSDLTSTINSLIRNADVARRQITILEERNRQLDRKANPHRYRLSSGAVLTNLYVSPKHVSIPNVHIWTKVKEETHEEYKYIEWQNDALQRFYKDEITEYELVNAIFEPFEQVSQKQAQLLGATFELMAGGPAQTHIGTGGGGSSSDMPWGEKKKGSIKR